MEQDARRPQTGDVTSSPFDTRLIRELQLDGRASIQDLARRLGTSRDLVSQRLRALTGEGGLRITAALDPAVAGHHVLVHGMVRISGPTAAVAERIAAMRNIVFVSKVSGTDPLVFESRHGSVEELHRMLDLVREIPAVQRVRVTTYAEVLKGFFVSAQPSEVSLDALDHELIEILRDDGRASFRELAEAVHLSPSSVRSRVRKLVDSGAIRISATYAGGLSRSRLAIGFGIGSGGPSEPVSQFLNDSPAVEFAARTHGRHDFIGTVVGPSSAELLTVLDELRALPGVNEVESWVHLDVVKEAYAEAFDPLVHLTTSDEATA